MPSSYDPHGRSAVVTGGAKGIGRAIAELPVATGASVAAWGRASASVTGRVTQAVLPRMIRAGRGRIVNRGALAGKEGLAGLIALPKALARELAGRQVFVNCVAPEAIDTEMVRYLRADVVNLKIPDSPMSRRGSAREVAWLAAGLCTDASRFDTGTVFDVPGGGARY